MMPVAGGRGGELRRRHQLGRAAAVRADAGLVGAVVERVEHVVVVAVGEELEAQPEDAPERDPMPASRPPTWTV